METDQQFTRCTSSLVPHTFQTLNTTSTVLVHINNESDTHHFASSPLPTIFLGFSLTNTSLSSFHFSASIFARFTAQPQIQNNLLTNTVSHRRRTTQQSASSLFLKPHLNTCPSHNALRNYSTPVVNRTIGLAAMATDSQCKCHGVTNSSRSV